MFLNILTTSIQPFKYSNTRIYNHQRQSKFATAQSAASASRMLFIAILAFVDAYVETFATPRTRKVWVSPAVPLANSPSLVSYTKLHSAWDGRRGPGSSWTRAADSGAEGRGSFFAAFAVGFAAALAGLRLQSGRKVATALLAGKELVHVRSTSTERRRTLRMAAGGERKAVAKAPLSLDRATLTIFKTFVGEHLE